MPIFVSALTTSTFFTLGQSAFSWGGAYYFQTPSAHLLLIRRNAGRLSENRNRSEGKPFWVRFFGHLRRIVVLFNENERKIWPKWLFRSRFSILGQPPRQLLMPSICIGVLLVKTGDPYDPILAKAAFVMVLQSCYCRCYGAGYYWLSA